MDEGPKIEANSQLEFAEFYHALRWYSWKKLWWLYGILTVLPTIAIVSTLRQSEDFSSLSRFATNLPSLIIPFLLIGLYYWSIYRNAKRQFKTNNSLRENRHYLFSEQALESSSPSSSSKLAWTLFHRIVETPESFLFFTSSAVFVVIPKRTLGSEERIEALRNLFRQRLGAKAKLKKR